MPIREITDTATRYYLIVFDEEGRERREPDGTLLSETVQRLLTQTQPPFTDVFFTSHGWKGDVPAAIEQYDRWIGAMAAVPSDRDMAEHAFPGFKPLIVGLHWPSLPWGDEEIPESAPGLLSTDDAPVVPVETEVESYAARIAATLAARAAIRTIVEAAQTAVDATTLPPEVLAAYAALFAESGLQTGDDSGRPGADQENFDPQAILTEARDAAGETAAGGGSLVLGEPGFFGRAREMLMSPLRQLSFWKMKDRARHVGETGGNALLRRLQQTAPQARFHLMGHSFGCIVVSATVAGESNAATRVRPVDSLFLVQGALSLWAYAEDIPYAPGTAGYFHRIMKDGLVRGPIVTTRSAMDKAVGRFYPLGARLRNQLTLGDGDFPRFGGIGSFGIQGARGVEDFAMGAATFNYHFGAGQIYNLEASGIIKNGGGASGAHSDIAHPEVAHAFWAAVVADHAQTAILSAPPLEERGGGLLSIESDAFDAPMSERGFESFSPAARPAPPPTQSQQSQPPLAGAEPPSPPTPATPSEPRWINAEIEDLPPGDSLATNTSYTLAFDVDVRQRETAAATATFADDNLFPEGTDEVLLTVQLDSTDFDISDPTRQLRVPRAGKSRNKARFDITPLHDGPSRLKATIHKEGNFIQQIEMTFDIGAVRAKPVETTAKGRPINSADLVRPRDVGLSIAPGIGGYDCVVWGAVSARARLPVQPAALAKAVEIARRELMKVVMYKDAAGNFVFQTGMDIPEADNLVALKTMARAGARLFNVLFFGPGAADDSRKIGEFLRKNLTDPDTRLHLQILAETAPLPWASLYVGDASEGAVLSWDNFIGMRHVIEQIPLQNSLSVSGNAIPSDPHLAVSINVNSGIDAQMGGDYVARQGKYWNAIKVRSPNGLQLTSRTTRSQVMQALANAATDDQILYFYCHADSAGLNDAGGPDSSCLVLTDARITLTDLDLDAPTTTQLRGNPLVFINACESAEMSPAFYDGFVPYFMSKGARGVVGTECKTPALFAVNWADKFFERFLNGQPLGDAFLELRREFLDAHRNPLGLLYAVHCDGDTQVQPALA